MADECNTVDIWVGRFPSSALAEAYFREQFDDDEKPVSSFAGDQGELFIDHDLMEHESQDAPSADLAGGLSRASFSSSYVQQAVAAFGASPVSSFDTVVLVWGKQIKHPVSVDKEDALLHYLGRFACDPEALPVAELATAEWYEPADPTPREQCPCCDYVSLAERGNYLICHVCRWEDDGQDLDHLDESSGPNKLTLREARENFAAFGACDRKRLSNVLPPAERARYQRRVRRTPPRPS